MKCIVTTSWDDGHVLDLRVAELLKKYGLAGTFYVSPKDREFAAKDRLTKAQIKALCKSFEIGAHTMTHPRLTTITQKEARKEIVDSKLYLEKITGKPVVSFCYPGGDYNEAHRRIIKENGFKLARTVDRFSKATTPRFEMPTTLHAYRHWSDVLPILKTAGYRPWRFIDYLLHWDKLAVRLFDKTHASGGVFHLWGHSWEVENNDDWQRLEHVLKHISARKGVRYMNNGDLVR